MTTTDPAWLPDPTGRHEFRWWDGAAWTEVVADDGVEAVDPVVAQQPVAHQPDVHRPPAAYPAGAYGTAAVGATSSHPPASPAGAGGSNRQTYTVLAILGATVVVLLVVLAVVVRGGGGDDEPEATGPSPREALIGVADMTVGWTESEVTYPSGENQVCEPRLEPPEPPRTAEADFERADPSGSLGHRISEYSAAFAAEYLSESRRQASECGTFTDEFDADGQTFGFTATSELLTGPTFGDETVWYVIHLEYDQPQGTSHDILVCLDRHGGVVSGFTLSTGQPMSDADRTMVQDLARTAAERLQGGAA